MVGRSRSPNRHGRTDRDSPRQVGGKSGIVCSTGVLCAGLRAHLQTSAGALQPEKQEEPQTRTRAGDFPRLSVRVSVTGLFHGFRSCPSGSMGQRPEPPDRRLRQVRKSPPPPPTQIILRLHFLKIYALLEVLNAWASGSYAILMTTNCRLKPRASDLA